MGKHRFKNKKMRGPGKGMKDGIQERGVRLNYETIVKDNQAFEKYYQMQKICPESEWDQMMAACREDLPTSFRITASRSESNTMLHIIENHLIRDVIAAGKSKDQELVIKPLPWYPNKMAWQLNLARKDIRGHEAYLRFHNFLISETESGYISRQEAVSMIPPLALKVETHHKVLDMCASPGSKTAQIIEMLHADDSKPEGYVIANDLDNKRCYMLVHQGKRLQSPAFVVTNHDASKFPDVTLNEADGKKKYMRFDRVLCDVPCSGDGTIRKNIDVWRKWSPSNGLYLQQVQYQILKRGFELLAVGGLLVYSTCSLNPIEDEAVVLRLLREANGSAELLSIDLPNLKHTKGLSYWKVCSRDLQVYDKMEDVPQKWVTTIRPYAFPPSEAEASSYHLDKCMRVLPHQQDTGGFFIALLSKTKEVPWEVAKEPPSGNANGNANDVVDTAVVVENKCKYVAPPPKKSRRMLGYKEDPYVFMTDDHEIWPQLQKFYGLADTLNSTHFLKRTQDGKIRNIYFTTETVRNFVINNENSLKIINVGVKALARIDNKWSPTCQFRLSQEGLPSLYPHITIRRVHVSKNDLVLMLNQNEVDKAPLVELFSEETRAQIRDLERGSVVLVCEFVVDEDIQGPRCFLELVGWKGAVSLRAYIQKSDRIHYLRLCGADVSKYEVNKFKDKEDGAKMNEDVVESQEIEQADEIERPDENEFKKANEIEIKKVTDTETKKSIEQMSS